MFLRVNYFAPPCVTFVHVHVHLFSKLLAIIKFNVFIFLSLPWALRTCYRVNTFFFLSLPFLAKIEIFFMQKIFLTQKGETKAENSAAHAGHKSHAFQRGCRPRAHAWFSLFALSYGIDLAEWGFPQTSVCLSIQDSSKKCLVSDRWLKPGHSVLFLRPSEVRPLEGANPLGEAINHRTKNRKINIESLTWLNIRLLPLLPS